MKRLMLSLLLLVGVAPFSIFNTQYSIGSEAYAQFQEPVTFSVKQNKVSDTELEIVFTGKVEAGWHVYKLARSNETFAPAAFAIFMAASIMVVFCTK